MAELLHGLALLAFAAGALLIAVGDRKRGGRLIAFAIVLAVVEPLIRVGVATLARTEVAHGSHGELNRIIAGLFLCAVVLAGLVALRRRGRKTEPTSQKDRVEPRP